MFEYSALVKILDFLGPVEASMDLTYDGAPVLCMEHIPVPNCLKVREHPYQYVEMDRDKMSWLGTVGYKHVPNNRTVKASDITMEDTDFARLWRSRPLKRLAEHRYWVILFLSRYFPVEIYRQILAALSWTLVPHRKIRREIHQVIQIEEPVGNLCSMIDWVPGYVGHYLRRDDGTKCAAVSSSSIYRGNPTALLATDISARLHPRFKYSLEPTWQHYTVSAEEAKTRPWNQ